jgi:putative endonuclease
MKKTTDIGKLGEEIAAEYLLKQGYQLTERNFTCRSGEIDIVAYDGEILVFAEVKYYRQGSLRDLHLAIDTNKQQKLLKAAQYYLFKHKIADRYVRFDAVLIEFTESNKVVKLELIKDAFRG